MMARLLRAAMLLSLLISVTWVYFWWKVSVVVAVAGALIGLLYFVPVLASQFWIISRANRLDPSPPATAQQHFSAWFAEVKLTFQVFLKQQAWQEHRFSDALPLVETSQEADSNPDTRLDDTSQPFVSVPIAKKQRGVVFIHGFLCNRGFWNPWLADLQVRQIPFVAISLEPVFGSIDGYAPLIERAVSAMTRSTGLPPLLICHSMGGLAARAWLRANPGSSERVSHIVTIGTPHHGTGVVTHDVFAINATQMKKDSPWLMSLAAEEAYPKDVRTQSFSANRTVSASASTNTSAFARESESANGGVNANANASANANTNASASASASASLAQSGLATPYEKFTCYYSNCDNIVFPARTATLPGADNRFVPGQAHVQMAFDETVMRESLARL